MLKIRTGFWVPFAFRFAAILFVPLIVLSFFRPYASLASHGVSLVLLFLAVIAITTQEFVLFDMSAKTYFEYRWMLGFKKGEVTHFHGIEKMFINRIIMVKENYKYAPGALSPIMSPNTEARSTIYKCFLKFDNGEKMVIDSGEDKDKLIARLRIYNRILKTTILDTSGYETILIE